MGLVMPESLLSSPYWLVLIIFFARVFDVSLGTFRTIVVFRGYKVLAAFIGFFEILIWLVAAGQVFKHLDQWYLAVAYASGFATGNFFGMWLESQFAMGTELIRCISYQQGQLAKMLREKGYQAIAIPGDVGTETPIEVIFIIEKRRKMPRLIQLIRESDPGAVYSVSDIKSVYDGAELMPHRSFLSSAFRLPNKRR